MALTSTHTITEVTFVQNLTRPGSFPQRIRSSSGFADHNPACLTALFFRSVFVLRQPEFPPTLVISLNRTVWHSVHMSTGSLAKNAICAKCALTRLTKNILMISV